MMLVDQIACVKREIAMRERCYPRWVEQGRIRRLAAEHELAAMRAVLETLTKIQAATGRAPA